MESFFRICCCVPFSYFFNEGFNDKKSYDAYLSSQLPTDNYSYNIQTTPSSDDNPYILYTTRSNQLQNDKNDKNDKNEMIINRKKIIIIEDFMA